MATEVNMSKLTSLVKQGKTMQEAAAQMKLPVSVVAAHFYKAEVQASPRLKIAGTAKAIVTARDKDGLRWERIAARTGKSVAEVKRLYEEGGGDLATSYTGRGRKPGLSNGTSTRKTAGSKSKTAGTKSKTARGSKSKTTSAKSGRGKASSAKSGPTRARTRAQRAARSGNPS